MTQKFANAALEAKSTRLAWTSVGSVTASLAMLFMIPRYVRPSSAFFAG